MCLLHSSLIPFTFLAHLVRFPAHSPPTANLLFRPSPTCCNLLSSSFKHLISSSHSLSQFEASHHSNNVNSTRKTTTMKLSIALMALGLAFTPATVQAQSGSGGRGTYYYQGGAFGSCGLKSSDNDFVVGAPQGIMKQSCGKTVEITLRGPRGPIGNKVRAKIQDTCVGCGPRDLGEFSRFHLMKR